MSCIAFNISPAVAVPKLEVSPVSDFQCRFGLVCNTSVGEWEVLYASDGILFTVDNGVILVKRK